MSRVTMRSAFIAVTVTIAGLHLVAVTLAALPPNRYSDATASRTGYLEPYFAQNWRLFAPAPVAQDREVLFQGSYVGDDGTARRTAWVSWTGVELDLIRHRLVGGRAGYVTNKLYGPLSQRYRGLGLAQRAIADRTDETAPPSWSELRADLSAGGADPVRVRTYVLYEEAAARLGTEVLEARTGHELTAVRYRLRAHSVVPYAQRTGSEADRQAARPAPTQRESGWRVPTTGSTRERDAVAAFDRRHR
ncbi:hypothetical protein GEV27_17425 [Aeromicrobium sp. S22]|uniref:DUF5819 family protein n=1 Tax=Aeromicrobium sp. S22 TaxID=2662029 RepID=UPI00129D884E|nr:DUF5819 family protein [Aeromicrobium sp. S22]MRK03296.1 hypothetical protein [Aeromicrobium sp. S22]